MRCPAALALAHERAEGADDARGHGRIPPSPTSPAQVVPSLHREQHGGRGNECPRLPDLGQRPEGIGVAVYEERRHLQPRQVGGPEVVGSARWVERVREQQESSGQLRGLGDQQAGLPTPVRLPAQELAPGRQRLERQHESLIHISEPTRRT
jgi:hypothetical protein